MIGACSVALQTGPGPLRRCSSSIALVYHAVLLAVFACVRSLFCIVDGRPLERVNASNVLSLVRLSSLPSIVFLIASAREAHLVPSSSRTSCWSS